MQPSSNWRARDTRPLAQFIRYGIVGASATVLHLVILTALSKWVYPSIDPDLADEVRANRTSINTVIAFFIANIYTYIINVRYVFVPGRHHRAVELIAFLSVSALSLGLQILIIQVLIRGFGAPTWPATFVAIGLTAVVNYLSRRFLVFKG